MYNNNCCWLKKFFSEGNYSWDNDNFRNKKIGGGLGVISYLYDCCNKFCGVKIISEGSFPQLSSEKIIITTYYYCDGRFVQNDTWGSNLSGCWKHGCYSLYTYFKGVLYFTPSMPETVDGKFDAYKSSLEPLNYRFSAYGKDNCKYIYKGETNFTKLLL